MHKSWICRERPTNPWHAQQLDMQTMPYSLYVELTEQRVLKGWLLLISLLDNLAI